MMFVYLLTIIISTSWALKMIQDRKLLIKKTALDIPLFLFLTANIFSTVFSIDRHISIWGYYSRSNGGLLSLITYITLYYALVSNFKARQVLNLLKAACLGGFLVSIWAIPEHFGISPSCIILTGHANASCWIQDVAARVFATLGQPNWLAAYLAMLIFPAFYFLLTAKSKLSLITYYLLLITYYLAFTFTYSRGATLGLLAGLAIFIPLVLWLHLGGFDRERTCTEHSRSSQNGVKLKIMAFTLTSFLIINILFGSALTSFKLVSQFASLSRPSLISLAQTQGTQLEAGGTESGKIRLIVWRGAIEIFKHYPIFGSGLETFAYSYYQYRPVEHNLVSEWDFLYNKAHNEYLNYLATTGIVGFLSYLGIIFTFITWIARRIKNCELSLKDNGLNSYRLILIAILASYISYLVQNVFGFSIVVITLFFYLFPGLAFVATDSLKLFSISKKLEILNHPKIAQTIILTFGGLSLAVLIRFYIADTYLAQGIRLSETNPGKSYNQLYSAVSLNPIEPFYRSELAFAAASAAISIAPTDATISNRLQNQALARTELILKSNPKNVSYFRTAVRTYYLLSTLDKTFIQKTLEVLDKTITIAPTDAKLTYNKAVILNQEGKKEEAIQTLQQTLKLKPNYQEAYEALEKLSQK